jgi:hypothetical protein
LQGETEQERFFVQLLDEDLDSSVPECVARIVMRLQDARRSHIPHKHGDVMR